MILSAMGAYEDQILKSMSLGKLNQKQKNVWNESEQQQKTFVSLRNV